MQQPSDYKTDENISHSAIDSVDWAEFHLCDIEAIKIEKKKKRIHVICVFFSQVARLIGTVGMFWVLKRLCFTMPDYGKYYKYLVCSQTLKNINNCRAFVKNLNTPFLETFIIKLIPSYFSFYFYNTGDTVKHFIARWRRFQQLPKSSNFLKPFFPFNFILNKT